MKVTRRNFLSLSGSAALAAAAGTMASGAAQIAPQPARRVIDFHVHLFGIGDGGTSCFVLRRGATNISYWFLRMLLGLSENGRLDQDYVERLVGQLRASSVEKAVLLAQDMRYDAAGKRDKENTPFYVPNDYLFRVVGRYPDLFIPCPSINPKRRNAIEELDRCAEQGARILKIHPPIQGVDPGEARFRPFYRRCAELGVIVMVHTGQEHSAETVGNETTDPRRLVPALEEDCTVVAAHSGMSAFFDKEDFFPHLVPLVRRFPKLYCDTSILAEKTHWRNLPCILESQEVLERAIHGSDTPFLSNPLVFWNRLAPRKLLSLASERNLFERDFRLKQALGLPAEVFERGAKLLGE